MTNNRISLYNEQRETILTILRRQGYALSCCDGRGTCGRCQIRFLKNPTLPTFSDRKIFTPEQLRDGYRLACFSKPHGGFEIEVCFVEDNKVSIVSTHNGSVIQEEGIYVENEETFLAVDLGTTTIAMQLIKKETGQVLSTYVALNPQRSYGKDVIARIRASINGAKEELRDLILHELEKGIGELNHYKEISVYPKYMILAGNTTMVHLLMGYDTSGLGKHPFTPVNLQMIETSVLSIRTIIFPGISAFVGGDIVAGLYQTELFRKKEIGLFLDLGTNGEMAIGNKDHILTTATAAGPAFEGGPTAGIIGTDMVKIVAQLLEQKIIDHTGVMVEPYFTKGIQVDQVHITQKDIRDLQMAKGAVHAGIQILTKEYGITYDKIDRVYLAGGFGYYLNIQHAIKIGLLPKELENKIEVVGNTSLGGAIAFGKQMATDSIDEIINITTQMNLAQNPDFEKNYIEALEF